MYVACDISIQVIVANARKPKASIGGAYLLLKSIDHEVIYEHGTFYNAHFFSIETNYGAMYFMLNADEATEEQ